MPDYAAARNSAKSIANKSQRPALILIGRGRRTDTYSARGCYNVTVEFMSDRAERDGWDVFEVILPNEPRKKRTARGEPTKEAIQAHERNNAVDIAISVGDPNVYGDNIITLGASDAERLKQIAKRLGAGSLALHLSTLLIESIDRALGRAGD